MHLREGLLEDLPYVTDIGSEALWNDEIVQYLAPNRAKHPLSHRDNYLFRTKKRFFAGDRLIVAITDEDDGGVNGHEKIVGFAFWSDTERTSCPPNTSTSCLGNGTCVSARPYHVLMKAGFEQAALRIEGLYRWYFNIDRSYDKLKLAKFWQLLSQNPFFEDTSHYWELEILAVAPQYQRQGVGSKLLEWGMAQAAAVRLPVVVAATVKGEHLYAKHGFKECGKIDFTENQFSWTAMVWYPSTYDNATSTTNG